MNTLPLSPMRGARVLSALVAVLLLSAPPTLRAAAETTSTAPADAATTSADTATTAPVLAYDTSRGGGVYGPTMSIDPAFEFYQKGDLPAILAQMRARGITAVRVIDTGWMGGPQHRSIAGRVRAAGMAPVLCMFPPTHAGLYDMHPGWRQKMLGGADGRYDWRTYLCPSRAEARAALAEEFAAAALAGPYDGIQIAEPWFEQWGGPEEKEGVPRAGYACVCDVCLANFRAASGGVDAREMLTLPDSPAYRRKPAGAAHYRLWQDMRVDAVTSMTRAIAEEARRTRPGIVVNLMVLSDARVEPGKIREYHAIDIARLVTEAQPDIVCVQDAWQDWLQKGLKPEFIRDYAAHYAGPLRALKPGLFIMSHADIGSNAASKRPWPWIRRFAEETLASGFNAPSFYEWSVSTLTMPDAP